MKEKKKMIADAEKEKQAHHGGRHGHCHGDSHLSVGGFNASSGYSKKGPNTASRASTANSKKYAFLLFIYHNDIKKINSGEEQVTPGFLVAGLITGNLPSI